jgi:hypothetical protein
VFASNRIATALGSEINDDRTGAHRRGGGVVDQQRRRTPGDPGAGDDDLHLGQDGAQRVAQRGLLVRRLVPRILAILGAVLRPCHRQTWPRPGFHGRNDFRAFQFSAFGDKQLDTLGTVAPYLMTGTFVRRVESHAVGWCAPEVLRVEAEDLLRDDPMDRHDAAEALLEQSIAIAEEQGAVAWELRSSTSLALLRKRQGRQHEAFDLVKPVCSSYTEGFETADLLRAGALIDALQTQ